MKLFANNGGLEYEYKIHDDYMIDFNINSMGLNNYIPNNQNSLALQWSINLPDLKKA